MSNQCSSNQIFDQNLKKCISCRDPTVAPRPSTPPQPINQGGGYYACYNNPISTYNNETGKVIAKTCDSGETLSASNTCNIEFYARK
jgi:hypothetical protein